MNSETVITAFITGVLTWLATQTKSKYDLKSKRSETKSNTEGMYVQNMSAILEEYKEQVSNFRAEVKALREENAEIRKEFSSFKDRHYKKIKEYEKYVELIETENEELKEENVDLKLEISYLKGEESDGNTTK